MKISRYSIFPFIQAEIFPRRWFLFVLALVLALGVFFRFANLDEKPVWGDEAHTFSVVSGYSSFSVSEGYAISEVLDELPTNKVVSVGDFLKYQYPNSERHVGYTLQKLYTDVHPPLYFLTVRFWVKTFGHSVSVLRSISAVYSLLSVLCIYWLCLELFKNPLPGIVGSVLLLTSPIQVIYAQEARPYSLLTLTILFSGASLLWALRTQHKAAWFTYACSAVLGIYSQYFFVLVLLGYAVYVVLIEGLKLTARSRSFLLATFASLLTFLPWAILVLQHLSDFKGSSAWMNQHTLSLLGAVRLWSENISFSFVDPRTSEYLGLGKYSFYFLIPLILALVAYSIYCLVIKTPKQVYLFVFTLIGSTALPLIAIDVLVGGNRQIWPRYIIPCLLGLQISVAYLLTSKSLSSFTLKGWQRKVWPAITTTLITLGIIFCSIMTSADTWWNKYAGEQTNLVSGIVHQAQNPLIVINRQRPGTVFFYNLDPTVKLLFIKDERLIASNFDTGSGDIFLLNPTQKMKAELEQQEYRLSMLAEFPDPSPVPAEPTEFWRITRPQ
ncbi:glycosyltransferase family 39 protein [Leptolyngbya sp. AN02str]|uniref:glycosyltransferase family 39 protein n=1 Tax=Leptolyngbya sp. AN02str TaxID=3423363 RepID=UPI003D31E26D